MFHHQPGLRGQRQGLWPGLLPLALNKIHLQWGDAAGRLNPLPGSLAHAHPVCFDRTARAARLSWPSWRRAAAEHLTNLPSNCDNFRWLPRQRPPIVSLSHTVIFCHANPLGGHDDPLGSPMALAKPTGGSDVRAW